MPPSYIKGVHMPAKDLTGQKFERLTVVERKENTKLGERVWMCKCDCGNSVSVQSGHLISGHTKSCGCLSREKSSMRSVENFTNVRKFIDTDAVENTRLSVISSKRSLNKNNTSKTRGVSFVTKNRKWHAYINLKGTRMNLGEYKKLEDAIKARKQAEELYFEPIIERYKKETEA